MQIQNHLIESMNIIQTIKTQNIENNTFKNGLRIIQILFKKFSIKQYRNNSHREFIFASKNISNNCFMGWAQLVLKGQLTLGQLIAFRIISGYVTQPILRLSTLSQRFEELKVSFERLGDVINQETESNSSDKNNISMPKLKVKLNIIMLIINIKKMVIRY